MVPFYSSFNFLFFIRRHQNGVVSLVFFVFLYGEKNNSGIRAKGIGIPICDFYFLFFFKVFMKVEVLIGFKMMRF